MGFFNRKKKQEAKAAAATAAAEASTSKAEKKEPLLAEEEVPADEPAETSSGPAWSNVDSGRKTIINPEEGSTDITLPPGYKAYLKVKHSKSPKETALFLLGCCGAPVLIMYAVYAALAGAFLTFFLMGGSHLAVGGDVNVAFIGNSYFFVNDLPRLMEQVTGEHIFQDSCLHASGSLLNILKTGNGMFNKWQSKNAMVGGIQWVTEGNTVSYLYDMGACSVPQLLTGQDAMLSYQNEDGHYLNDGSNPCLQDPDYLDYEASYNYTSTWDYVVMVDQSKRMAFEDARDEALLAINYTYGPLISEQKATPIIVQPHAFWSSAVNMTGLDDIPTFTSLIMEGAQTYKKFMNTKLSKFSKTKIAPVGDAYLTVWEEDYELWTKLFLEDNIHPSGYGSYLYAMVLHASIYHVMPPKGRVVIEDTIDLFSTARKLHANETSFPSKKEALSLWKIARKVTLLGFKPQSYKTIGEDSEAVDEYEYDAEEGEPEDEDYGEDDYLAYDEEGYEYGEEEGDEEDVQEEAEDEDGN